MNKTDLLRFRKKFHKWSKKKQRAFIESLSEAEALELRYASKFWLRDKQLVDVEDWWRFWIIKAGRGFGKTLAGATWLKECAENYTPIGGRHDLFAICGPTHKDVTQVMIPAIQALYPDHLRPSYNKSDGTLTFKNGAIAYCYSSEVEIRGPNIEKAWVDELAKWYQPDEQFETLRYAVRIGSPQILITTTPKKHIKTLRTLVAKSLEEFSNVKVVEGSSFENEFLDKTYREDLEDIRTGSPRKFRQEALGELLNDSEDALWNEENIQTNRLLKVDPKAPYVMPQGVDLYRIVVAVDPAGSSNPDSDETGIVVCAVGTDGHGYVLQDVSGRYTPDAWAKKAIDMYHLYKANTIIAEKNFGGEMVADTIHTRDRNVAVKVEHSALGKQLRAEPIAAKYTQNLVHHVGSAKAFEKLEDQMTCYTGQVSTTKRKDDRMDALVFGLTALLIKPKYTRRLISNVPDFS